MAAVTQIRNHGTVGRAYYDRKIAEGMTGKAALRSLKRKVSDAIYNRMINDAGRPAPNSTAKDPGGQTGNDSASSVTGSHPESPALRKSHSRASAKPRAQARQAPNSSSLRSSPQRRRNP